MSSNNENFVRRYPIRDRKRTEFYTDRTSEQGRRATNDRGALRKTRVTNGRRALNRDRALSQASPHIADETASTWTRVLRLSLLLFFDILTLVFIIGGFFLVLCVLFENSAFAPAHTNTSVLESAGLVAPTAFIESDYPGGNAHITDKDIRAAYRRTLLHFHPDKIKAGTSEQLLEA
ncbi:hypothetical protein CMQ_6905 [Grosmannia clavigera kw1407]|uniref:J domain-containing protein n=1 Tax=Grosmannia clavigera (strain kw1407 / UAMH 11150) TaxID=655863 RepID=F0X796_GROCL|nr:uncharacterized protein CMQ_6905 [Grosmannia clavigera kw1407]EFX06584.1 hypothetical protein CMQ_6905 [Grosmannia clavigera kw1407]